MDNCCYIIGIRVNHRVANAVGLQELLTKFGCNIKLQVCGEKADQEAMLTALNAVEGIKAKMLEL